MQVVYNIAQIAAAKGIKDAVLSPGSRCAPLTIAFNRHPDISTRTVSDERSAAFIGLGIALQTQNPVVLICTSGSAAYNYAPAVAEAFFQNIPLIILTADRPPEWIDQLDGQTIRQTGIYGSHVKGSYNFPLDLNHPDSTWHAERIVSEAINLAREYPAGPVHINIPLREPFYPQGEITFTSPKVIKISESTPSLSEVQRETYADRLNKYANILIVAGQTRYSHYLIDSLQQFTEATGAVLLTDVISNCQLVPDAITHHDLIFSDKNLGDRLRPDLLITFGLSVISKGLKQYLRKYKPSEHWHIQEAGYTGDTFQSLTEIIRTSPEKFFRDLKLTSKKTEFADTWSQLNKQAKLRSASYMASAEFSELLAVNYVLESIPEQSLIHLSNSMPVRYVNYLSMKGKMAEVFCNRGTSGIDGVVSTAYGAAISTDKIVTVITGDVAFFYDRNAFWNNYLPNNLRIILLNNHGGGIFRMIDGPAKQPELEEYFETRQPLTAANLAREFGLDYYFCQDQNSLENTLTEFFKPSAKSKIIEIESDSKKNTEVFKKFQTTTLNS